MPSVTKTFTSEYHSASVNADGSVISTNIAWVDSAVTADPKSPVASRPVSFTNLRVSGGKVYQGNVEIADAPADLAAAGQALATKLKALADSLITAGKIKP